MTDDPTNGTDPADHRDLLRRVDGSPEGMNRLLSYMESDVAGGSFGPHHDWDGRSRSSRARLLAERLEHIAEEMERDDRFPDDPGGYDSPFK
ncbi:hypothetical protein BRC62_05565 [Halobacteriales archaeon QH_10_67_13]|nr:MAG: hypothetical protein BRC62_05565 [Halobacteriales archaeon QH_10_67_13]